MNEAKQALEILVAEHDAAIAGFGKEMLEVKTDVRALVQSVNNLTLALNRNPIDLGRLLQMTLHGMGILASVCAFIIYVATGHFAADWAQQREFNKQVQQKLDRIP